VVRDPAQLTARSFDLLVVGGGICGLAIARDAALRGVSVALVERNDFGSGSSFNHLRTIHGGLRYLQSLDLARARESVAERRTLARIAPQALRVLPFAVPLSHSISRGPTAMRAGLLLDRILTRGRNDGVAPSLALPAGRVISRSDAIARFPGMRRQGLAGAALFHDYVAVEADRLTFSWALGAAEAGAVMANYVEAVAPLRDGSRVVGVRGVDRLGGSEFDIGARVVVNAAGAGIDRLLAAIGASTGITLIKAMNLVTSRDAGDDAIAARSKSGRNLFLVPWRRRALFGTWESARPCSADEAEVTSEELALFIAELNDAFPALDLSTKDVTLVHSGLVPGRRAASGAVSLEKHEQVRDHAEQGIEGLISVAATKYTTARGVAERVVDRALTKLGVPAVACRTREPLPGGDLGDPLAALAAARAEYDALLPSDALPHLIGAYGSRFAAVADLAAERADLRTRVNEAHPVVGAELVWAVRHEMAMTLADAVVRRTPLGALGYPGDEAVDRAAAIVGSELGWDAPRRQAEIEALRAFYARKWGHLWGRTGV
jgi:glycerol-3-phosphate dehydrogenase